MPLHLEVRKVLEKARDRYGNALSRSESDLFLLAPFPEKVWKLAGSLTPKDVRRRFGEKLSHIEGALEDNSLIGHPPAIDEISYQHRKLQRLVRLCGKLGEKSKRLKRFQAALQGKQMHRDVVNMLRKARKQQLPLVTYVEGLHTGETPMTFFDTSIIGTSQRHATVVFHIDGALRTGVLTNKEHGQARKIVEAEAARLTKEIEEASMLKNKLPATRKLVSILKRAIPKE